MQGFRDAGIPDTRRQEGGRHRDSLRRYCYFLHTSTLCTFPGVNATFVVSHNPLSAIA